MYSEHSFVIIPQDGVKMREVNCENGNIPELFPYMFPWERVYCEFQYVGGTTNFVCDSREELNEVLEGIRGVMFNNKKGEGRVSQCFVGEILPKFNLATLLKDPDDYGFASGYVVVEDEEADEDDCTYAAEYDIEDLDSICREYDDTSE